MSSLPLTNPSQLILRNCDWLMPDQLLMVGLPADALAQTLLSEGVIKQATGLSRDFSVYRQLRTAWDEHPGLSLTYAPTLSAERQTFDGILLFLQKSKPLMDFWLKMAQSLLSDQGVIWLVGENSEGIKSWKKRLKQSFGQVKAMDSARHSVLLEASEPLEPLDSIHLPDYFQSFPIDQGNSVLDIYSLPGVFSHGRLDVGTRVLLDTLTDLPEGKVLDFGCGAGVISAFIHSLPGERSFTLVDSDALALQSSEKTLTQTGCQDFKVLASDGLSEVEGQFDLIISNPPFHQGVKTHYAVTEQFLREAAKYFRSGGEMIIVANSFLKYPSILKATFGYFETQCVKNGFSIYKVMKS